MLEERVLQEKYDIFEILKALDDMLFDLALYTHDESIMEQWHALSRARATIHHLEKYPIK